MNAPTPRRSTLRYWLPGVLLVGALAGCSDATSDPNAAPAPTGASSSHAASDEPTTSSPLPTAPPSELGLQPRVLNQMARTAREKGSTCLLVMKDGVVARQWLWRGTETDTSREVFSVTKSITSTLVGIAQDQGLLDIDDRAARYIPAWRGTDSAQVTIRDLLSNDSGRHWDFADDYTGLVAARNRTRYAVNAGQDAPPGTVWAYNNTAIQALDAVLVAATGKDTATYADEVLLGPLGMDDSRMGHDTSGKSTSVYAGLNSTCADLARFGQMIAQGGRWDGKRIVSAAWVAQATGESSQQLNASYGLLWWLNRAGEVRGPVDQLDGTGQPINPREGSLVPGRGPQLFAALGLGGQTVMVDPATDVVVVRLGDLSDLQNSSDYGFADAAVALDAVPPAGSR